MMEVYFLLCALGSADCQNVPVAYFIGSQEECDDTVADSLDDFNAALKASGVEIRGFECRSINKESNT